jgi:hypothetical protein
MTTWLRKGSNRPNQGQQMKGKKRKKGVHKAKTHSNELKRASYIRFCHKKLKFFFSLTIWNHGNHGTLSFLNTYECQETQIRNPFYPILGFGLVKDFWKWNFLSLKMEFL